MNIKLTNHLFHLITNTQAEMVEDTDQIYITSNESDELHLFVELTDKGYVYEIYHDESAKPLVHKPLNTIAELTHLIRFIEDTTEIPLA